MPRQPRPDGVLLLDLIVAADDAMICGAGLDAQALAEAVMPRRAVLHALMEVGEAATRLSPAFRVAHPDIPWSAITGLRHRIVHDYAEVDLDIVVRVLRDELPGLVAILRTRLPARQG